MQVDLKKMDLGNGLLGLVVYSMAGLGSLKFTPDDEGVVAVSCRVSPEAKKMLEQMSKIGGISQAAITRACVESGLNDISALLIEVKKAQEIAAQEENDMFAAEAEFNQDEHDASVLETLASLRKESAARKAARK